MPTFNAGTVTAPTTVNTPPQTSSDPGWFASGLPESPPWTGAAPTTPPTTGAPINPAAPGPGYGQGASPTANPDAYWYAQQQALFQQQAQPWMTPLQYQTAQMSNPVTAMALMQNFMSNPWAQTSAGQVNPMNPAAQFNRDAYWADLAWKGFGGKPEVPSEFEVYAQQMDYIAQQQRNGALDTATASNMIKYILDNLPAEMQGYGNTYANLTVGLFGKTGAEQMNTPVDPSSPAVGRGGTYQGLPFGTTVGEYNAYQKERQWNDYYWKNYGMQDALLKLQRDAAVKNAWWPLGGYEQAQKGVSQSEQVKEWAKEAYPESYPTPGKQVKYVY